MTSNEEDVDENRRNFLRDAGILGGITLGFTTTFGGLLSGLHSAKVVFNPNYWKNEPIVTAYEPALEHIADTGELSLKSAHLKYDSEDDKLDEESYETFVEEIMEELPGIDNAQLTYDILNPQETEWAPEELVELQDYQFENYESGLPSLMASTGANVRDEEYQLVNLVMTGGRIFGSGGTLPNIEGVSQTEDNYSLKQIGRTTAHEAGHLLGIGHTLGDGMTNSPFGSAYASTNEDYFGTESKNWFKEILEKYE